MQRLYEVVSAANDFHQWPHADKIRLFAWALHADGKGDLKVADLAACFDSLHLAEPGNLHRAVQALAEQGDLLKSHTGYRLSKPVRDRLANKHGSRPITVQVHALLAALPEKLLVDTQREYLDEALRCFRAGAWRGAIIMAWNLAFDHLCQVIVSRLDEFNRAFPLAYPKSSEVIVSRTDLQEIKESTAIRVCRTAGILDKTQAKCLERHLEVRNDAAHPSGAQFSQPKAEAFILDVIPTVLELKVSS